MRVYVIGRVGYLPDDNRIVVAVAGHLLVHDKGPLEGEPVQRWFPLVNKITSTTGNNKTQIRWDIIFNHWTDSTVRYNAESKKKNEISNLDQPDLKLLHSFGPGTVIFRTLV